MPRPPKRFEKNWPDFTFPSLDEVDKMMFGE
jgi:hypothetical protein